MKSLFVVLASMIVASAFAQEGRSIPRDAQMQEEEARFDALDHNGDGRVSKSEAERDERLSAHFVSVDADGDGYITRSEYLAEARNSSQARDAAARGQSRN